MAGKGKAVVGRLCSNVEDAGAPLRGVMNELDTVLARADRAKNEQAKTQIETIINTLGRAWAASSEAGFMLRLANTKGQEQQ